jgi:hypothetical protein
MKINNSNFINNLNNMLERVFREKVNMFICFQRFVQNIHINKHNKIIKCEV